jgi:PAS domain S-box-containing protein
MAKQRFDDLGVFQNYVAAINALIDDKLQPAIDRSGPDAVTKIHAALEIEINVFEAFAAIQGYILRPDPALKREIADAKADFKRFDARYRATNLTDDETRWLDRIANAFIDAVAVGNEIIALTDMIRGTLEGFEANLEEIDYILDDQVQSLILAETVKAADAKAATSAATLLLVAVGAIVLLVGSGSAWVLSRRIVTPVRALVRGMEIVGKGNLTHRIDIENKDEFGQLATGFNRMAKNIQSSRQTVEEARAHLEQRIEERTRELTDEIAYRKKAEQALKESEERLKSILDNTQSAIMMKTLDGHYLYVNRHFIEWYGFPAENYQSMTSADIFSPDIAAQVLAQDKKVLKSGLSDVRETERQFADGKMHSVVVSTFPVFGSDGEPKWIGSIATDVTEQRKSEAQLRQAQKMEAVGQLTGGMAHDFNNLLGVIIGNLDFLTEALQGNDDLLALTEAATKAALNGASLNRQLLAFSRKQSLSPKVIDLNEHVSAMLEMLRRTLGETIEIEVKQSQGPWTAEADPAQVDGAVLNLALNARDAMPEGGTLTIETMKVRLDDDYASMHAEATPGEYVMLSVTDTGTGMPADVLAQVFEPFFTTKEVGEGSGLGLSMVFGFAKQSGGHAEIESEEGAGTTVKMYLPHVPRA